MASNQSFTRSLSIVAVAVVAFAALELLVAQPAFAGIKCCKTKAGTISTPDTADCICDSSTSCNITKISRVTNLSTLYNRQVAGTCWNLNSFGSSGQISSEIACVNVNGTGTTFLDSTSFTQTALLFCEVKNSSHNDTGFCQYDLTYSRPAGLTTCVNNPGNPGPTDDTSTLTYSAFCSQVSGGNANNKLTVTGTLKCPESLQPAPPDPGAGLPAFCGGDTNCILRYGIAEEQGQCSTLFPADPVSGLLAGQVLGFSQTVEGLNCPAESQVISLGSIQTGEGVGMGTRSCSGGTFNNAPVDCTPKNQEPLTGTGLAVPAVQFDVSFTPPLTHNVSCQNSQDVWDFTIFGNQHLDVNLINVGSLAVEGVSPAPPNQITCNPAVGNNLVCHVKACAPDSGQPPTNVGGAVKAARNPDLTADVTVTGTLNSGTPIFGEQTIATSGQ